MKRVNIAAGVIVNAAQDKIFITRRHADVHQGGKWEFPGGKIEANETPRQAVVRELREEVGINATDVSPFISLDFDFPDKALSFDFFLVSRFEGEPQGQEGQHGEWAPIARLSEYTFPEANDAVLEKIRARF
ncbi:8-oxo-dGTP diphosphatase MutT [Salinivibrio proteolyticus]|uniref:8-oxo-dGTP diphosphatase MutT n=1 Tax=Salinivibrio proteolyticus TaxID=334715 RepID=UPI000988FC5B|nr:8-oxo-dGTP diphosphatase MutT [Salinivibrio proteolyticus]OOF31512.1 8-oxo-dGTP diphosphatase [Salinivibrio proteolyticus]